MSPTNNGNGNGNGNGNRNGDGAIPVGDIRFYDNYLPQLDAGDYVISATQTMKSTALASGGKALDESGQLTQNLSVLAPRFALDPLDIHSVFPPATSTGTYDQNLPHIVLTKRNLPWERYLGRKQRIKNNQLTPWVALMLFAPDEITPPASTPWTTLANPSRAGTYKAKDVLNPPTGTLGPDLESESQDDLEMLCRAIDVATDVFTRLAPRFGPADTPTVDELKYLTHCRQVNTGDQEIISTKDNGWFSVVIGNRFPGPGPGPVLSVKLKEEGLNYTATPDVTISGGGGTGATAVAEVDKDNGVISSLTLVHGGSGYSPGPTATISGGGGTGATATIQVENGVIVSLTVTDGGEGYASAPVVFISGGGGTGATATAQVAGGAVTSIAVTSGGSGYIPPLEINFSGGGGSGASATVQTGAPWVAHLVSLEGFEDYLVDSPAWPSGVTKVRLVSLYSWIFTCLSESGDFRDLMLHLTEHQATGGAGLLLRLPVTATPQPAGSPQATVQTALNEGYTALDYETLIGDRTFAWYRGPFLPAPRPLFPDVPPYQSGSAAMIYDQTNALFDHSYAAAWQIGRLAALSDGSFGTKLLQWRRQGNSTINLLSARLSSQKVQALIGLPDLSQNNEQVTAQLQNLLHPRLISNAFSSHLVGEFSETIAPSVAQGDAPPGDATDQTTANASAANHVRTLKNLLAHPAVQQVLLATNGESSDDDSSSPFDYITQWLAELCLLYNVPFVNLVPDARMLPPESLRFFFVDPNYLEALMTGALSIGIQSSRDQQYQSVMHSQISAAKDQALALVRDQLMGQTPAEIPAPPTNMAGLLLRSAVVSGWPGLEVRGYSDSAGTNQLKLLRMDRLAPDVLLCLFPNVPARVEISEPKQSLAFGHEDDFDVDLRWVTDAPNKPIGSIITGVDPLKIYSYFRTQDPAPVLEIKDWHLYLQHQLNIAYGNGSITLGPADFALEMVRAPEELVLVSQ